MAKKDTKEKHKELEEKAPADVIEVIREVKELRASGLLKNSGYSLSSPYTRPRCDRRSEVPQDHRTVTMHARRH